MSPIRHLMPQSGPSSVCNRAASCRVAKGAEARVRIVMLGVVVCGAWGFRSGGIAGAATGLITGSLFTVLFAVATNRLHQASSRLTGAVGLVVIPIAAYMGGWTFGWAYVIGAMTVLFILAVALASFMGTAL